MTKEHSIRNIFKKDKTPDNGSATATPSSSHTGLSKLFHKESKPITPPMKRTPSVSSLKRRTPTHPKHLALVSIIIITIIRILKTIMMPPLVVAISILQHLSIEVEATLIGWATFHQQEEKCSQKQKHLPIYNNWTLEMQPKIN